MAAICVLFLYHFPARDQLANLSALGAKLVYSSVEVEKDDALGLPTESSQCQWGASHAEAQQSSLLSKLADEMGIILDSLCAWHQLGVNLNEKALVVLKIALIHPADLALYYFFHFPGSRGASNFADLLFRKINAVSLCPGS